MATGDVQSVTILSSGDTAQIVIAGFSKYGNYSFGTLPSSAKIAFSVTSKGFDNTGAATTIARTVYGTIQKYTLTGQITGTITGTFLDGETITQATSGATAIIAGVGQHTSPINIVTVTGTPDATHAWTGGTSGATIATPSLPAGTSTVAGNVNKESVSGGNLTINIGLSEYIYAKDNSGVGNSGTAVTVSIGAGLYTDNGSGGTGLSSNAVSNLTVTNNSTQAYLGPISRWAIPGGLPQRGANFLLECVAFDRHAANQKPVACVVFTAADQHGNSISVTATAVTKSTSDGCPVYAATIPTASFTAGDVINCNYTAYPWVGDVTQTTIGTAFPSLTLGTLNMWMDPHGPPYAYVNSSTGSDTTGVASATAATALASPFATMGKAGAAIQSYNNSNYARNNADGGEIRLMAGNHLFGAGSNTITTTNAALTITADPAASAGSVIINGPNATARTLTKLWRLAGNIKLTATDAGFSIGSTDYWVIDGLTLAGPGSGEPFSGDIIAWQNCNISGYTGLGEAGGPSNSPILWRSNQVDNSGGTSNAIKFTNIRCCLMSTYKGSGAESNTLFPNTIDSFVIAYCQFLKTDAQWVQINKATANNVAAVENLYEFVGNTSPAVWDGTSTSGSYTNFIYWHNTIAGNRVNIENDIQNNPPNNNLMIGFSFKNNSSYFHAYKGDYFNFKNNSVLMQNAQTQTGFSDEDCGLGLSHNNEEITSGNFPTRSGGIDYTRATAAGYTTDNSAHGTGAGNGNYIPAVGSTLIARVPLADQVIPFDLAGNARSTTATAIGAFAGASEAPSPAPTHNNGLRGRSLNRLGTTGRLRGRDLP